MRFGRRWRSCRCDGLGRARRGWRGGRNRRFGANGCERVGGRWNVDGVTRDGVDDDGVGWCVKGLCFIGRASWVDVLNERNGLDDLCDEVVGI